MRSTAQATRTGEGNICLMLAEPSEEPRRLRLMNLCDRRFQRCDTQRFERIGQKARPMVFSKTTIVLDTALDLTVDTGHPLHAKQSQDMGSVG
jgi:hypothetical protein